MAEARNAPVRRDTGGCGVDGWPLVGVLRAGWSQWRALVQGASLL